MTEFYKPHLALVHDRYYSSFAREAAAFVRTQISDAERRCDELLDLGCGSGTFAAALLDEGLQVRGVDWSEAMIAIARQHAPGARFYCASVFDVEIDNVDVVCAIGEVFNYLFDERNSYEQLGELLLRIHNGLKPDGLLVFDMLTTELPRKASIKTVQHPDAELCIEILEDADPNVLVRRISGLYQDGAHLQQEVEIHRQRLYAVEEINSLLTRCGFRFDILRAYGQTPFRQGHYAWLCRAL